MPPYPPCARAGARWLPSRSRAAQPAAPRLGPDAVARRVQDRDLGRDSRVTMRMKLADRHGRVRERVLEVVTLRGRDAPGAAAGAPDGDRLPRFASAIPTTSAAPASSSGSIPTAEDERFLFLPSLGRVRRIAGSETQESFVGSDFTYEDIGGRELDEYTYSFAGADGESASWTAAGRPAAAGVAARVEAQGRVRAVSARRVARAEGQLPRGPGRHLQPPQRAPEGLHRPATRADRRASGR